MFDVKRIIGRLPFASIIKHLLKDKILKVLWHKRIQRRVRFLRTVGERPLKVCFCVIFDSVFPLARVFELMCDDASFDPYILVIPDVSRGSDNMYRVMKNSLDNLSVKYGDRVLSSLEDGRFISPIDMFDCFAMMNPYSGMTHEYYRIPYLASHGSIVFMTRYFTETGTIYSETFNSLPEMNSEKRLTAFLRSTPTNERTNMATLLPQSIPLVNLS